jgi:formate-dependent nitrite reductase membrane component NrfD
MFAANVWHWWIGVILLVAGIGAVLQTVVGYLLKVSAMRYPNRRQRQIQGKK